MGVLGIQSDGLRMAMPGLYLGLVHQSAIVRAAAAEAYGKICGNHADDLVNLAHEAFLLLLQDPYVVVHQSAVRALERGNPASAFRERFAERVGRIIIIYREDRENDAFLSKALDVFLRLNRQVALPEPVVAFLFDILAEMEPNHAWTTLRFLNGHLAEHPGFTDVIISILANEATYPFYLTDVAEKLKHVAQEDISRVASTLTRIAPAARRSARGHGNPTIHILAALSQAREWEQAKRLLDDWLQDDQLRRWPGAVAGITRFASAVEVELAVVDTDRSALEQALGRASSILETHAEGSSDDFPFFPMYRQRVRAVELLLNSGAEEGKLLELGEGISSGAEKVAAMPGTRYMQFGELLSAYSMLLRWRLAVRNAEQDANRFLLSAQQRVATISDESSFNVLPRDIARAIEAIGRVTNAREVDTVEEALLWISLPLPLDEKQRRSGRVAGDAGRQVRGVPSPVVVIAFSVDGEPLESDMVIQPGVVHDLSVQVDLTAWPEQVEELVLQPVSVEPPTVFELPSFRISASPDGQAKSLAESGRLALNMPQTLRSRPLEFIYRATMRTADNREIEVHLEGQRQFTIRSYDVGSQPVTGNPEVDFRLLELTTELRQTRNISESDRNHFLLILGELGRIAGESLASNLFGSIDWTEASWQDWLWNELRRNPGIGSDLEKHPQIAAGITDLSFHRVRIELKVEKDRLLTLEAAIRFTQQTAQYVAGSQKRLGILAILDVSPKETAPGAVSNSIHLEHVPDPGGGRFPILIGLVIVRGNLARPSDLS
jgi:hypothetical protein